MSLVGADPLRAMRQRIVELVAWFGEDAGRLPAAQAAWRRDDLWDRRRDAELERWEEAIDRGRAPAFVPLPAAPAAALFELECLDLCAWLAAGNARLAPPEVLGSGDRERYLIRLARERTPHTARQAGLIYTHLRYHAIVPTRIAADPARSYRVRVKAMPHGAPRCDHAVARGRVAVATTSFGDHAPIDWTALTVPTASERADRLGRAIAEAARAGVDILVAPELTVPPSARASIIDTLRWGDGDAQLALIVPGTFHERVADRTVNRAVLLDGKGNALCEHTKLTMFGELEGWLEEIAPGDEITVLITPLGTVAIAICKDFCDYHVGRVWETLQPEWLLVPAYGRGASAHEAAAARIARMVGTVTVLAHQGDRAQGVDANSFVHTDQLTRGNRNAPEYFEHSIILHNESPTS